MKILLTFCAILSTVFTFGQIPDDYSFQDRTLIERYVRQLEQDHDIVIDPIERMPVRPSSYSLASGNWGAAWTGSTANYQETYDRATRPVVVFIFDTSPNWDHPYLQKFAWNEKGKSYTGEATLQDGEGHGYHCAGIIGASSTVYELGIAKALVEKGLLKGIPREVLDDEGSGAFSWVQKALEDANKEAVDLIRQGYFVIYSLSLGGPGTHTGTDNALKAAKAAGVFVCVAAGNTYSEGLEFPGRSAGAHAIGSIDGNGSRSNFSTYGQGLFMSAPGRNILSTYIGGGLAELSGTSMATPCEAALAAIAASVHPSLNADQIEQLLIDVATDIDPAGYDIETGYGYDFVGKILQYQSEPETPGDDPQEPPQDTIPDNAEKGARYIRAVLPGPYTAIYQAGGGLFKEVQVCNIVLDFKTKLYSEQALINIEKEVDGFFTNRAVTLTKTGDPLTAGYWLGRFLEIHLKKQRGVKSHFIDACIKDTNGNTGKPENPKFFDFFSVSKRTTFRY